jgi:hypothetical protein
MTTPSQQRGVVGYRELEQQRDELRAALEELVTAIETWEADVESIIGRVPNTGMNLAQARAALGRVKG